MKKILSLILLVSCTSTMLVAMDTADGVPSEPKVDAPKPPLDLAEVKRLAGDAYNFVSAKSAILYAEAKARDLHVEWLAAGVVLGYLLRGKFSVKRNALTSITESVRGLEATVTKKFGDVAHAQKLTLEEMGALQKLLVPSKP